jgi:hypothetical protein
MERCQILQKTFVHKKESRDYGSGFNIQQAEFLSGKLPALHKNDRNLSVRIERLKRRMAWTGVRS